MEAALLQHHSLERVPEFCVGRALLQLLPQLVVEVVPVVVHPGLRRDDVGDDDDGVGDGGGGDGDDGDDDGKAVPHFYI